MASSFVPLFAEEMHNHGRERAFAAASNVLTLLGAFLSVLGMLIAAVCMLLAFVVPLAPRTRLTLLLTALMIAYSVLICLTAVCGVMLNTLGHFSRPALAPVFLNVAMITAAWMGAYLVPPPMELRVYALGAGVLLGGTLQLWYQTPALARYGFHFHFTWDLHNAFVRRILALMGPALIGAGVSQINILIDRFMALSVNERGAAVLTYADRLVELPLGMFGIALATAVLPMMSFCAARNDMPGLIAALGFAMRQVCFIMLPAAVGLILLAEPIVQLLFQRGAFDAQSTYYTAAALRMYAPALPAFAFAKIIVPTFYARKDTRTPVKIGVTVLILNVILNYWLMHTRLREAGLALSTSMCSYLNAGALLVALRWQCGRLGMRAVAVSIARIAVLGAALGVCVWWTYGTLCAWSEPAHLAARAAYLVITICAGLGVYAALAFFWRQRELLELLSAYARRRQP